MRYTVRPFLIPLDGSELQPLFEPQDDHPYGGNDLADQIAAASYHCDDEVEANLLAKGLAANGFFTDEDDQCWMFVPPHRIDYVEVMCE